MDLRFYNNNSLKNASDICPSNLGTSYKGELMSKLKGALEEWLENYGHSLGFDMTNYPAIEDWDNIKLNNIDAKEYYDGKKKKSQ